LSGLSIAKLDEAKTVLAIASARFAGARAYTEKKLLAFFLSNRLKIPSK